MKQRVISVLCHKRRRRIIVISLCLVVFIYLLRSIFLSKVGTLNAPLYVRAPNIWSDIKNKHKGSDSVDFRAEPSSIISIQGSIGPIMMPTSCGLNFSSENIIEMRYDSFDGMSTYSFLVSLHDPDIDQIISRGIKEGLFGPKSKYASVDEMHSICEHKNQSYSINCGPGRVFVEVGSALGMVSLYAASRGMKVYAFDPLIPNIQRLNESLCLNGERQCLKSIGANQNEIRIECSRPSDYWGAYSPSKFSRFCNLVGSQADYVGRVVESEPGNMAATMRGGGSFRAQVKMVTVQETVRDSAIELLLLTCQGFEYEVRIFRTSLRSLL
jgi:FkbM family methyltransferase